MSTDGLVEVRLMEVGSILNIMIPSQYQAMHDHTYKESVSVGPDIFFSIIPATKRLAVQIFPSDAPEFTWILHIMNIYRYMVCSDYFHDISINIYH